MLGCETADMREDCMHGSEHSGMRNKPQGSSMSTQLPKQTWAINFSCSPSANGDLDISLSDFACSLYSKYKIGRLYYSGWLAETQHIVI